MQARNRVDVLVIGSGMGGGRLAAGLAPTGAQHPDPRARRTVCTTARSRARSPRDLPARPLSSEESWLDGAGAPFNPGNYYYVGGNTKLFGAVLIRYRAEDFWPMQHRGGDTPGWPFPYEELEPWYSRAEQLYHVRGEARLRRRPSRAIRSPIRSRRYRMSRRSPRVRERMQRVGLHPFSLPLGVDIERWLKRAPTTWDAFPECGHRQDGRRDLRPGDGARATRTSSCAPARESLTSDPGARRQAIAGVELIEKGERRAIDAKLVVLSAGAVNSAALLLRSSERGLANSNDMVGRHFMNHNSLGRDRRSIRASSTTSSIRRRSESTISI